MSPASQNVRAGRSLAFVSGAAAALIALVLCGFLYLKFGHPPVATADPSFPFEAQIVHVPLHARIDREMETAPFSGSEQVYVAGAHIYAQQCASCHGTPGHDVAFAASMFPRTPQLWKQHRPGVVGVSDDEPGETYWKVRNGIRLSGMPSYQKVLSTDQMWQVSLLLKAADKPLSPEVQQALRDSNSE